MTTRTVIGQYVNIDGSPVKGYIEFTPSSTVAQGYIIPVSTVRVALDDTGSFSVDLPVTDDPIAIPVGWKWSVEEKIPNGNRWYFDLPTSVTPLNLADVVIIGDNEVPIYGVAGPKGDKGDTGNTGPMGEVTTAALNAAIATEVTNRNAAIAADNVSQKAYIDSYRPLAGKNYIINGCFNVNQRGFSSGTNPSPSNMADLWRGGWNDGSTTFSLVNVAVGNNPTEQAKTILRVATSGQTLPGAYSIFYHVIEDLRLTAGKTMTLSFWAKANSGTPKVVIELIQRFGTGGAADYQYTPPNATITLSTSWQRYSLTFTVPSIAGKALNNAESNLLIHPWVSGGSTYSARNASMGIQSNTFDFWGFQLEEGTVVTPYETLSYAEELRACQRYYYRATSPETYTRHGFGVAGATNFVDFILALPVPMCKVPVVDSYSNLQTSDTITGHVVTNIALSPTTNSKDRVILRATTAATMTQYRPYFVESQGSTAGHIAVAAEL